MTTAQVTLETGLGIKHRRRPAIVFQPLDTADFQAIVNDTEELLTSSAADTGTTSRARTTSSATAGWSCATRTSRISWWR